MYDCTRNKGYFSGSVLIHGTFQVSSCDFAFYSRLTASWICSGWKRKQRKGREAEECESLKEGGYEREEEPQIIEGDLNNVAS